MKREWRKEEKALYLPKNKPEQLVVPVQKFFIIQGKGDPNKEEFSEKIGVLYSLAYAVRMMPKSGYTPPGYEDYTVYPLEGLWDLSKEKVQSGSCNKDEYVYTLMIRQPDFVTQEVAECAFEQVNRKKPHPFLGMASFTTMEDGMAVQMMHSGSYDDEYDTFQIMDNYLQEKKLVRRLLSHKEIYVSHVNREHPEKQKTTLRYFVRPL